MPLTTAVSETALQSLNFNAQAQAERLAENTVTWMDDSMQSFNFANNPLVNNARWAEIRSFGGDLAAYDADFNMKSPASFPQASPDA